MKDDPATPVEHPTRSDDTHQWQEEEQASEGREDSGISLSQFVRLRQVQHGHHFGNGSYDGVAFHQESDAVLDDPRKCGTEEASRQGGSEQEPTPPEPFPSPDIRDELDQTTGEQGRAGLKNTELIHGDRSGKSLRTDRPDRRKTSSNEHGGGGILRHGRSQRIVPKGQQHDIGHHDGEKQRRTHPGEDEKGRGTATENLSRRPLFLHMSFCTDDPKPEKESLHAVVVDMHEVECHRGRQAGKQEKCSKDGQGGALRSPIEEHDAENARGQPEEGGDHSSHAFGLDRRIRKLPEKEVDRRHQQLKIQRWKTELKRFRERGIPVRDQSFSLENRLFEPPQIQEAVWLTERVSSQPWMVQFDRNE
ncbi:MAG TPA: hypothetical protein PLP29_09855 [Candidatus Ozemobacteraceae bacterium]|nr:hypothetical protein [Candidatus Ozemobacteraceae bacterium]